MRTYPLHFPVSSNVPMRIFLIHLSEASPSAAPSPVGFGRCESSKARMDLSVVSNPRLPKKSVGPGGCFCTRRIFCPVFEMPAIAGVPASAPSAPGAATGAGRPLKSSPANSRMKHEHSVMRMDPRGNIPSVMSRRRPSRLFSDIVIATVFASGVAKSTYAKLEVGRKYIGSLWGDTKVRAVQQD